VKIIIFALISLVLTLGIIAAFPFSDAAQPKDSETECRDGQILVFRINSNNYSCVSSSTADKWEEYGIAEKVVTMEEEKSEVMQEETMFNGFQDDDGDSIPDVLDLCPHQPETFNGIDDKDGCPDNFDFKLDSDMDGRLDAFDTCPLEPETYNFYLDEDGCPDSVGATAGVVLDDDYDGDSIPDVLDLCPHQPETFNGFQDEDGCPDKQAYKIDSETGCRDGQIMVFRINSNNYVCVSPSTADKWEEYGIAEKVVPMEEEKSEVMQEETMFNGFQDDDGDSIPDVLDLCPHQPETFNGFQDDDGCPDKQASKIDSETECREGQISVFRIISNNYVCVSPSTADKWEEYGIAEKVVSMEEEKPEVMEEEMMETEVMEEEMMETDVGIQTIETRSGTITIDHDYLTPESAQLLSDELFFQRAVQVYHLALPAVGGAGIFYEQDKVGATVGDIIYWSDFMNSDIELLTGNTSVLYFMSLQDLSDGPIVFHLPAGNLQGHADNIYQQVMTDWGIVGPNEGNEASFLFLPPNYDGEIPPPFDGETENHFVVQSDTMQFLGMGRVFVNAPDMAAAEELLLKSKCLSFI